MTTIRLRGRREKGYILLLSPRPIDDKIKVTFDRDSKSSRNVPQRLCYALTISILSFSFLSFSSTHVAPWPPLFRLHKFHVETLGGETWNLVARSGKRSTTRTSLLRYLSIFHFEFYSIIGGVRARSPRQQLAEIDYRKYWTRSWQVHRWWSNRHLQFVATASFHLLNEYLRDNLSYAFEITVEYKILPRWIWSNLDVSKFPRSRRRCSRSSFLSLVDLVLISSFYQSTSIDGSRSGAIKNTGGQCHPPSLERPTAPWPLCSSLPFLPWLLATVYCQFSRAKRRKKEKTEPKCDEIVRPVTSRNGTFYRSGIKPRGKHYSHDNKLWILRIPQTGLESRPEMGFESIYSNGYTISYTVSNDIIGFHFN